MSTAVVLINLGTPDQPTPQAIKTYLAEFLSDQRVVNLPRAAWKPILHGIILKTRPKKLQHNYQMIWGRFDGPIRNITRALTERVATYFAKGYPERNLKFYTAMTYGNPSVMQIVKEAERDGCDDFLFVPLYPQYAGATTGAVFDQISRVFQKVPIANHRFIRDYHDHPRYIHALAKSLERYNTSIQNGAHVLFSFHGIPMSQVNQGDLYPEQCEKTAAAVAHAVGLSIDAWSLSYQSKFGPGAWLTPATIDQMSKFPRQGIKDLVVICPGFSVDCLETIEEIKVENKQTFLAAGGERFQYVKALNATKFHVDLMVALIESSLYSHELRAAET